MTLGAGEISMGICQVWCFVPWDINLDVAIQAQFCCRLDIRILIDRRNRQPGIFRVNHAFFDAMTDVAGYAFPISLCQRGRRIINFEFAGCAARWHIIHRGDVVKRRMATRTGTVRTRIVQDVCIPMRAGFPQRLD
jgi:hypothetical protein